MNPMNSNQRKSIKAKQGQVECEFCKKSFPKTSILVHIGKNESCKSRFDEQKRKKNCLRKQQSRKKLGKEKELKRQREAYARNKKNKENKGQYFQNEQSKLANAEDGYFEKVNITSRENYSNMEYIKFDSQTTYKIDMSALHANVIVLNPNQSQKSNVVAEKDTNVLCKCCKKDSCQDHFYGILEEMNLVNCSMA